MNVSTCILSFLLFFGAVSLNADEPIACAAVWACDERGEVLPQYSQGSCAQLYASQCASFRADLGQQELRGCTMALNESRMDLEESRIKLTSTRKRLRDLRRALRNSRR